jgi:hypothetical protein
MKRALSSPGPERDAADDCGWLAATPRCPPECSPEALRPVPLLARATVAARNEMVATVDPDPGGADSTAQVQALVML